MDKHVQRQDDDQSKVPFVPSLLVEIRRRMGAATFAYFHQAILNAMDKHVQRQDDDQDQTLR